VLILGFFFSIFLHCMYYVSDFIIIIIIIIVISKSSGTGYRGIKNNNNK